MYRAKKDRAGLNLELITWLQKASENDALYGVRATYDILSFSQRVQLIRAPPNTITSATSITTILDESTEWGDEWATQLFKVISSYDQFLIAARVQAARIDRETRVANRAQKKTRTQS